VPPFNQVAYRDRKLSVSLLCFRAPLVALPERLPELMWVGEQIDGSL
jgi:hypothetical protein